jgi:PilZ domain
MSKASQNEAPASRAQRKPERRGGRRCKFTQLMRIRPTNPEGESFDDLRGTISVSRTGIYFQTSETGYAVGMRLFVTMPYSQDPSTPNREYLAEVVRKDALVNGMTGIGIKMLLEMSPRPAHSFGHPTPQA